MERQLKELLVGLNVEETRGDLKRTITGVAYDSRQVQPGDVFVCIEGFRHDGHDFVPEAVARGAVALVVEKFLPVPEGTAVVKVSDTRLALPHLAAVFYHHPSRKMRLIGVTGTNGKTTTTHLIEAVLREAGFRTGLIGTIHIRIGEDTRPVERTTPESLDLQGLFSEMVAAGIDYCVMEVSSHALTLGRVDYCDFDVGVFTNISQDHLDFHQTLDAYREAKARLFSQLALPSPKKGSKTGIINLDDPSGQIIADQCQVPVLGYGIKGKGEVQAKEIVIGPQGVSFTLHSQGEQAVIHLQLTGKFSVYNALAAAGAALAEGISLRTVAKGLAGVPGVPGRFERIDEGQDFAVIVDYAHTPDGLENILQTAGEFAEGRRIVVFGCGGDRDRTKRPQMGRIAAENAEHVIVTSDNPRSEDPLKIIADIEPGLKEGGRRREYDVIPDRREAIIAAVKMASPGDIVILAGKGHETYQIVGDKVLPFDDREIARTALRGHLNETGNH